MSKKVLGLALMLPLTFCGCAFFMQTAQEQAPYLCEGKLSRSERGLLRRINQDLKIPQVTILCNEYAYDGNGLPLSLAMIGRDPIIPQNWLITLKPSTYFAMSVRLRRAVLAHELGHTAQSAIIAPRSLDAENFADGFSAGYVGTRAVIDFLSSFRHPDTQRPDRYARQRIEYLEELQNKKK